MKTCYTCNFSPDDWDQFENFLVDSTPVVGFVLGSRHWQNPQAGFNVDANLNAFHRSTLGALLPYDASLDAKSVFYSQFMSNMLVAALYAHQRNYWPENMRLFNSPLNDHSFHANYPRAAKWHVPKTYLSKVWAKKGCFSESFDIVSCGNFSSDKFLNGFHAQERTVKVLYYATL